jgi:hypothetical protein
MEEENEFDRGRGADMGGGAGDVAGAKDDPLASAAYQYRLLRARLAITHAHQLAAAAAAHAHARGGGAAAAEVGGAGAAAGAGTGGGDGAGFGQRVRRLCGPYAGLCDGAAARDGGAGAGGRREGKEAAGGTERGSKLGAMEAAVQAMQVRPGEGAVRQALERGR